MARVDVITGVERRRRWSDDQKRAVVAAAFAPGAVVAHVARRADLCPSLIYRWRRDFGGARPGFAEVIVAPINPDDGGGNGGGGSRCGTVVTPVIEVAVGGSTHVRIPASMPPELAAAVVAALVRR